jgi:hypothetical protein
VAEAEQHWRKSRDNVVGVCDAVGAPLVGDILGQFLVTNAGASVWVLLAVRHLLEYLTVCGQEATYELNGIPRITQLRRTKCSNGAAETVACEDNSVSGIGSESRLDARGDVICDDLP